MIFTADNNKFNEYNGGTRKDYTLNELVNFSAQANFFKLFKNKDKILPKSLVFLFYLLLFLRRTVNYRSLKLKTYRIDRFFLLKYTVKRYEYFIKLNDKERLIKINQCIILNNGIIKYLNLDNVDYVNKLTKNFQWNKKGIEVFEELINYRYNYKKNKDEI